MASDYKPESPSQYKEDQIILNSGRLLFNSKSDAILMFAPKAIGLSSAGTINLDSDNDIILNADGNGEKGKISLGLNAISLGEPVLKGDITCVTLSEIVTKLIEVCDSVSLAMAMVQPPQLQVTTTLANVSAQLAGIRGRIDSNTLKSKKTFTL